PSSGSTTRSLNERSSSWVRSVSGAEVRASSTASERLTPGVSRVSAPAATSPRSSATKTQAMPATSSSVISDLHLDHARHPERADRKHDRGDGEHQPAARVGEHRTYVVPPHGDQVDHEARRQSAEDPRREPALRGQRGDVATQGLPDRKSGV